MGLIAFIPSYSNFDPIAEYYEMFPKEITTTGEVEVTLPVFRPVDRNEFTFEDLVEDMAMCAVAHGDKNFLIVAHGLWIKGEVGHQDIMKDPPLGLQIQLAAGTDKLTDAATLEALENALPDIAKIKTKESKLGTDIRASGLREDQLESLLDIHQKVRSKESELTPTSVGIMFAGGEVAKRFGVLCDGAKKAKGDINTLRANAAKSPALQDAVDSVMPTLEAKDDRIKKIWDKLQEIEQFKKRVLDPALQGLNITRAKYESTAIQTILDELDEWHQETDALGKRLDISWDVLDRLYGKLEDLRSQKVQSIEIRGCDLGSNEPVLHLLGRILGAAWIGAPKAHIYYTRVSSQQFTLGQAKYAKAVIAQHAHDYGRDRGSHHFALQINFDSADTSSSYAAAWSPAEVAAWVMEYIMPGSNYRSGDFVVQTLNKRGSQREPWCLPLDPKFPDYLVTVVP
jgi:hypothetical protein